MKKRKILYSEKLNGWRIVFVAIVVFPSLYLIQYALRTGKKVSDVIRAHEERESRLDSLKRAKNDTIYYIIHPTK